MRSHPMYRVAVLLLAGLSSGCVVSAGPLIPEHEASFDTGLLGTWEAEDSSERAVVTRGDGRLYRIEYRTEDGDEGRFEALLGRIGDRVVLDVWPAPRGNDVSDAYDGLLIPGHVPIAIELDGDRLQLAVIEPDALQAALEDGSVGLTATETDEQLVLHGTSAELGAALGAFFARDGALTDGSPWRRVDSGRGAR